MNITWGECFSVCARLQSRRAFQFLSWACVLTLTCSLWADQDSNQRAEVIDRESLVQLTFPDNVELKTVLDYVAARLGTNIIYDEGAIKQKITIRTPTPIRSDQLLPLLRSALKFRGFALVESQQHGWLTVVPNDKMSKEATWDFAGDAGIVDSSQVVTSRIHLEHIPQDRFVSLVEALLTKPGGNMIVLPEGKDLIVTDYAKVVDAVIQLQQYVDVPSLAHRWKVHRLAHASVQHIAKDFTTLLSQAKRFPGTAGKQNDQKSTSAIILPILNAFLLSGTHEQIQEMQQMLQLLDVPPTMESRIYKLQYTGAQRATQILKQLTQPMQESAHGAIPWTINTDLEANSLVVTCPAVAHALVEKIIRKKIDTPTETSPTGISTRILHVKYARAEELAATLRSVFTFGQAIESVRLELDGETSGGTGPESDSDSNPPAMKDQPLSTPSHSEATIFDAPVGEAESLVRLTVDTPTNNIIATGPASILNQIQRLIQQLDHHRPQVLIRVTIISVNKSDSLNRGIEVHYLKDRNGQLETGLFSSFGLSEIDTVAAMTTATISPGLNAALLRSSEVSIIVKALQTDLNGQVIAKPTLLVADNQTGHLSSLNEQPFTSINSSQTVSTSSW